MVRVPTNVDPGDIRFREELQSLTRKGDECVWRGLETQVGDGRSSTTSEPMDDAK